MRNTVQIVLQYKIPKFKIRFEVCCMHLFIVLYYLVLCYVVLDYAMLGCLALCCAVPSNNIPTIFLLFRSPWKARECFQGRRYSKESDVWAFGIVLWEMFMKTVPFQSMEDDTVIACTPSVLFFSEMRP